MDRETVSQSLHWVGVDVETVRARAETEAAHQRFSWLSVGFHFMFVFGVQIFIQSGLTVVT